MSGNLEYLKKKLAERLSEPTDMEMTAEQREMLVQYVVKEHPNPNMFSGPIRRRIRALLKLQTDYAKLEARFYKDIYELECDFDAEMQALAEERRKIVVGEKEPSDEEVSTLKFRERSGTSIHVDPQIFLSADQPGIPSFWRSIFYAVPMITDICGKQDDDILKHLVDVKSILHKEPMGFTLEFHFSPNEYFTNRVLTKEYYMKCSPPEVNPFDFDGTEIVGNTGCTIDWKPGKNVTKKLVMKKQRSKSGGDVRTVTKTIQLRSFFNFFNTFKPDSDPFDVDRGVHYDYDMASYLRERVIPRAVLYFTGEAYSLDGSDFSDYNSTMTSESSIEKLADNSDTQILSAESE